MQVVAGIVFAAVVAGVAFRSRALTAAGALAAFLVGASVFGAGGWPCAFVLFAFFVPSTLLSRIGKARKRALGQIVGKLGPRDAWQVAANGGVAALAILASPRFGAVMLAAFAGAFAAASSDTWGTEIGTLARGAPRSILTGRTLEPGLSGGITLQGTLAEFAGAALVAAVAALAGVAPFWPVFAAGVGGAMVDSLLGAGLQALRHCPLCALDCETNPHQCGTPTSVRRGVGWIGNDAVNLAATASGAALAAAVFLL